MSKQSIEEVREQIVTKVGVLIAPYGWIGGGNSEFSTIDHDDAQLDILRKAAEVLNLCAGPDNLGTVSSLGLGQYRSTPADEAAGSYALVGSEKCEPSTST